jgi:hypothetical protein
VYFTFKVQDDLSRLSHERELNNRREFSPVPSKGLKGRNFNDCHYLEYLTNGRMTDELLTAKDFKGMSWPNKGINLEFALRD